MYKLVALDLDDTLLGADRTISRADLAAHLLARLTDENRWITRFSYADGTMLQSHDQGDFAPGPDPATHYVGAELVGQMAPLLTSRELPLQVVMLGPSSVEGATPPGTCRGRP